MDTDLDEVRRMMLERHARYLPVIDQKVLMGVISFYDVAKAVVESQDIRKPDAQSLYPRLARGVQAWQSCLSCLEGPLGRCLNSIE